MMRDVNRMDSRCLRAEIVFHTVLEYYGKQPRSILELGCATGRNLAQFCDAEVRVGIEPYAKTHASAAELLGENAIFGDHTKLDTMASDSFDLGITCSVLDHIEGFRVALHSMCRVCKELILIEPIVKGKPRQARPDETKVWRATWYHDYEAYLKTLNMWYELHPLPLYSYGSGPYYHVIHVKCREYRA